LAALCAAGAALTGHGCAAGCAMLFCSAVLRAVTKKILRNDESYRA
jgi:hypothetical protein